MRRHAHSSVPRRAPTSTVLSHRNVRMRLCTAEEPSSIAETEPAPERRRLFQHLIIYPGGPMCPRTSKKPRHAEGSVEPQCAPSAATQGSDGKSARSAPITLANAARPPRWSASTDDGSSLASQLTGTAACSRPLAWSAQRRANHAGRTLAFSRNRFAASYFFLICCNRA